MRGRHFEPIKRRTRFLLILLIGGLIVGGSYGWRFLATQNKTTRVTSTTAVTTETTTKEKESSTTASQTTSSQEQTTVETAVSAEYQNLAKTVTSPAGSSYDQSLMEANFIGTALIVQNGQLILQKGYGMADNAAQKVNTPQSHYQLGSIQKSMTATLIMQAVAAGKISLTTPLSQFYPQIKGSETITIEQMLRMTSGLNVSQQPNVLTDEQGILDFAVAHTTTSPSGKFHYAPINFVLLAGILKQLNQSSYYQQFQAIFQKEFGLRNFGFYPDWAKSPNKTTSYKPVDGSAYEQVINETQGQFAQELGTGNIDMTTGDLYWYYHLLAQGKFYPTALVDQLWQVKEGSQYVGGMYLQEDHFRAHGLEQGQEVYAYFDRTTKNMVILMTNVAGWCALEPLTKEFYQQVVNSQ